MSALPSYITVRSIIERVILAEGITAEIYVSYLSSRLTSQLYTAIYEARFKLLSNEGGFSEILPSSQILKSKNFTLEMDKQNIQTKKLQIIKELLIGLALILCMILVLFLPSLGKRRQETLILIFGLANEQLFRNKSISALEKFLRDPLKVKLNSKDQIIVEYRSIFPRPRYWKYNIKVVFDIAMHLYKDELNLRDKISLLSYSIKMYLDILGKVSSGQLKTFSSKALVLDIPLGDILLKTSKNIELIVTPSNLFSKPCLYLALFGHFDSTMIWYSANSIPIRSIDKFSTLIDESYYLLQHAKQHLVWTNSHKKYLESITLGSVSVRGSLMFYLPEQVYEKRVHGNFQISIFDVTPSHLEFYQSTFYSIKNCINFLSEIERVRSLLDYKYSKSGRVICSLKHKRELNSAHSQDYQSFTEMLKHQKDWVIRNPNLDIYQLMINSDFVICYPYTSPAIIAKEMGVPVCYFSPSSNFELLESINGIPVHRSAKALENHIELTLTEFLQTRSASS